MTALLNRLHARLGDFWWYSLMLFCAMRTADGLNVFVGLWLLPKYVKPSKLGADYVLLNDAGTLRFIDPPIRLKSPAREVIAKLMEIPA